MMIDLEFDFLEKKKLSPLHLLFLQPCMDKGNCIWGVGAEKSEKKIQILKNIDFHKH